MTDGQHRLYRRYARWLVAATADGTTEEEAKRRAINQRIARLYPPRPPTLWQRIWNRNKSSRPLTYNTTTRLQPSAPQEGTTR